MGLALSMQFILTFFRSEANDLALRIARQNADSEDIITLDGYTNLLLASQ